MYGYYLSKVQIGNWLEGGFLPEGLRFGKYFPGEIFVTII